jgi:hypothetical protein
MTTITSLQFVLIIILIVAFTFLIFSVKYHRNKKRFLSLETKTPEFRNESPTLRPHALFVDLSPKSADIVELAVEVWRMNNRILKAVDGLTDTQKRGLESSLQKFIRFLDHNNIKFIDHTGQKYNEGMNIEVLSFEKNQTAKYPFIKETIEPSITCKGIVVKKGKVVVINN